MRKISSLIKKGKNVARREGGAISIKKPVRTVISNTRRGESRSYRSDRGKPPKESSVKREEPSLAEQTA